jgi:hypothetical protein
MENPGGSSYITDAIWPNVNRCQLLLVKSPTLVFLIQGYTACPESPQVGSNVRGPRIE